MYLHLWEADQIGTDVYHRTTVDSVWFSGTDWGRISECGDVDGDGVDECIWTTPDVIRMYKAVGDDQLQEVWHWNDDHGGFRSLVSTVYDINNDGYNELVTAGNGKISIFEVDAVDLLSPNKGTYQIGDTIPIRWVTHSPPECDSLSLFLRLDSLWNLQTVATGLPGTDTLYRWVVPSGVPDTGRIVVIAYGGLPPLSEGLARLSAEENRACTQSAKGKWGQSQGGDTSMERREERDADVSPARGRAVQSPFSISLGVYDVGGRLVRSLSEGEVSLGRYEARIPSGVLPAGIYFLRLDTPGFRDVKKAVVAR